MSILAKDIKSLNDVIEFLSHVPSQADAPTWDEHYAFLKCIKVLIDDLGQCQLSASDIIEVMGMMAWGVDIPHLTVELEEQGTCVINPEIAKQITEAVYRRLQSKGGWLRRTRENLYDMDRSADALVDRIVRDCSRTDDDGKCCNDPDCAVTMHRHMTERLLTSRHLAARANAPRKATAIEIAHWFRTMGADSTQFKMMFEGFAQEIEQRYHVEAERK